MKKLLAVVLVLLMMVTFCSCSSNSVEETGVGSNEEAGDFKMTTDYAAEISVQDALEQWLQSHVLSLESSDFEFVINNTEKSDRSFGSDSETGLMWYNAYGLVSFYNDYGDVVGHGDFSVFFGHDGKESTAFVHEDTVVNLY